MWTNKDSIAIQAKYSILLSLFLTPWSLHGASDLFILLIKEMFRFHLQLNSNLRTVDIKNPINT